MEYGSIERIVLLLDKALAARAIMWSRSRAARGSRMSGDLVPVSGTAGYEKQVRIAAELAAGPGFDVIQVPRRDFFTLGAAALVRRSLPGTRIVATLHGAAGTVRRHYGKFTGLASFVFVSQAQASGTGLAGTVIRNAVDTGAVPFRRFPAVPPYLAFVGRVSREKGVAEAAGVAREAGLPCGSAAWSWTGTGGTSTPRCGAPAAAGAGGVPRASAGHG
jgi:glycosyltransferase involved in cell wall biosynthesis